MNKTETFASFPLPERRARLQLIRTDGIGPILFRQLIERFGTGQAALDALPALLAKRKRPAKVASADLCERELETAHKLGAEAYFLGETRYPHRLAAIEDAPPLLYALGDLDHITPPASLGIVGARNASASGIKLTKAIACEIAKSAITVVSGLARGIDTAAHEAALEGSTVACVAGGLDIIYPQENTKLYHAIRERGAVVSEMPPGTQPQARHFPRRNRIISGLSDGVLIIEAAERSGSLITARFAAEQGRDVFAAPGSPLDPRARGGNKLIKDGAVLVQSTDDILDELRRWPELAVAPPKSASPPTKTVLEVADKPRAVPEGMLSLLSHTAIHVDELIRMSGMKAEEVLVTLMEHEIAGDITRHAGGKISLS
ncbi:DNA-processing protein DprA [Kordiimonas aestuarii]|uniref:DNA-processing protein DprA n=1 Tax=Kordiimonas aestuarii TaxID=1005925 RepID=UPI0021D04A8E|nr:DNA-processing protein DprA [Kordiimonas aestuarii]